MLFDKFTRLFAYSMASDSDVFGSNNTHNRPLYYESPCDMQVGVLIFHSG